MACFNDAATTENFSPNQSPRALPRGGGSGMQSTLHTQPVESAASGIVEAGSGNVLRAPSERDHSLSELRQQDTSNKYSGDLRGIFDSQFQTPRMKQMLVHRLMDVYNCMDHREDIDSLAPWCVLFRRHRYFSIHLIRSPSYL